MKFRDNTLIDGDRTIKAEVGSPVRLGHLPNAIRLCLMRTLKGDGNGWGTSADEVLMRAQTAGMLGHWFDHWGSTLIRHDDRDVTALVSEPYGLCRDDIEQALRFAEAAGCKLYLDACSEWYPTRTLRMLFIPAKPREQ